MSRQQFRPIALCATLVAVLSYGAFAHAAVVVDQQQTTAWYYFPVESWAQSFTPTQNNIVALDLSFVSGGAFNIQIKDLSSGYGGPVIGQTGFIDLGSGIQHIVFPSPIPLTPGSLYDISVRDSTPSFIGDYSVSGWVSDNLYANGIAHSPGSTANGQWGHDWYFVTYADDLVPEPSTLIIWSLLGTLAVGIGWWRRRKAA